MKIPTKRRSQGAAARSFTGRPRCSAASSSGAPAGQRTSAGKEEATAIGLPSMGEVDHDPHGVRHEDVLARDVGGADPVHGFTLYGVPESVLENARVDARAVEVGQVHDGGSRTLKDVFRLSPETSPGRTAVPRMTFLEGKAHDGKVRPVARDLDASCAGPGNCSRDVRCRYGVAIHELTRKADAVENQVAAFDRAKGFALLQHVRGRALQVRLGERSLEIPRRAGDDADCRHPASEAGSEMNSGRAGRSQDCHLPEGDHSRNRMTPARARSSRYSVTSSIVTGSSSADTASRISSDRPLAVGKVQHFELRELIQGHGRDVRAERRGELVVIVKVGRPLDALASHRDSGPERTRSGLDGRVVARRSRESFVARAESELVSPVRGLETLVPGRETQSRAGKFEDRGERGFLPLERVTDAISRFPVSLVNGLSLGLRHPVEGAGAILSQPHPAAARGLGENRGRVVRAGARQGIADRSAEKSHPLELGGVEVLRNVLVGVDVDVRPVVEVEHGDSEGAVAEDLVVASEVEGLHFSDEVVLGSFWREDGVAEVAPGRGAAAPVLHVVEEDLAHVADEARDRRRWPRDEENGFRRGGRSPHHIHVNSGLHPGGDVGPLHEIGEASRDLGRPEESDGSSRSGKRSLLDQERECAGRLENRRGAARVVVRARALVIEVAGEDDLLAREIAPRDHSGRDLEEVRNEPGLHLRANPDRLSRREPCSERRRRPRARHEREGVPGVRGIEVPPPHEIGIVSGPARPLIREVAQNSRRRLDLRPRDDEPREANLPRGRSCRGRPFPDSPSRTSRDRRRRDRP